jgi:rhodanese-related sulfurtransferase
MRSSFRSSLVVTIIGAAASTAPATAQQPAPTPSVYQTTLEEKNQKTPEISTETLLKILATGSEPVFDVRTAEEYAIAHIPGSINVYEKEVERIAEMVTNLDSPLILYCNGPSCGKSKRTSEQLLALGYTQVRRYQLGLPVWRALSQTVQTDLPGLLYMYARDGTAVWVDARTPAEFKSGSMPGAVNVQAGEATAANDDGRLPFRDKGTRIVVIGNMAADSRIVAEEIAKKAYWNSSFFGGTLSDLVGAGLINHPPVAVARSATIAAGPSCTAVVAPAAVDGGSYDPDTGDTLSLSIAPQGPLAPGVHGLTLIATDNHGSSASAAAEVTIADQTPPALSNIAVASIERTGHRGVKLVTVAYDVVDNCGTLSAALSVTSGRFGETWSQPVDEHHLLVRSDSPFYWITVTATDAAGNQSARRVLVRRDE